jgi:arylsulfatase A-like enzyme
VSTLKNIVFIFADQWRGTPDTSQCHTPNLDKLKKQGINFRNAISGCSQCSPYRGSLLTGLYPLSHGVLVNDSTLSPRHESIAKTFKANGYKTAYIGKWHVYGSPAGGFERRNSPIPADYRLGFDYWQGNECNHNYNQSPYYLNDTTTQQIWEGYDAFAQTKKARRLIKSFASDSQPFLLMLSWGPPHDPYHTAPEEFKELYQAVDIKIPENVPEEHKEKARNQLHGYYSHISALDQCLKMITKCLKRNQLEKNTLVVLTSDHGDMLFSQGLTRKLYPFEESVRIPFVIQDPDLPHKAGTTCDAPIDAPDVMPTLLGLANLKQSTRTEGRNWAPVIRGEETLRDTDVGLLNAAVCSGPLQLYGMKAYRGVRTMQYTYARNEHGPWLLFDNHNDPFQKNNLIQSSSNAKRLLIDLDDLLHQKLKQRGDKFETSDQIIEQYQLIDHVKKTGLGSSLTWENPWS